MFKYVYYHMDNKLCTIIVKSILHLCTFDLLKNAAAFWGGVEVSGPTGPLLLV